MQGGQDLADLVSCQDELLDEITKRFHRVVQVFASLIPQQPFAHNSCLLATVTWFHSGVTPWALNMQFVCLCGLKFRLQTSEDGWCTDKRGADKRATYGT